jgi:hypothetical protein
MMTLAMDEQDWYVEGVSNPKSNQQQWHAPLPRKDLQLSVASHFLLFEISSELQKFDYQVSTPLDFCKGSNANSFTMSGIHKAC